jgi:hypothetical protein
LYYEVVDAGVTAADIREAAERRAETLAALTIALGEQVHEPETRNQLLWIHYGDALYYAAMGLPDRARQSTAWAIELAPDAAELRALSIALDDPNLEGAIDIRPYRVE